MAVNVIDILILFVCVDVRFISLWNILLTEGAKNIEYMLLKKNSPSAVMLGVNSD